MKKLLSILLSTLIVLTATACESKEDKKETKKDTRKVSTTIITTYADNEIPNIDMVTFDSLNDVELFSDLVVVGEFMTDGEVMSTNEYFGNVRNGRTICTAPFKITRILKDKLYNTEVAVGDYINVVQYYFNQDDTGNLYFLNERGNAVKTPDIKCITPIKKGDKWILYLYYGQAKKDYWIASELLGRYHVPESNSSSADDLTAEQMGFYEKNPYIEDFYNQLVEAYNWNE